MAYLLVPYADRALLRRVLVRADQILGYPRTHSADEPGVHVGRGGLPYTETAFEVLIHDTTGPALLNRALAVQVAGIADALAERFIEHNAVRKRLREWVLDQGWELRANLPDTPADIGDPNPWSPVPVRDGEAGSADGVPIPEGDE